MNHTRKLAPQTSLVRTARRPGPLHWLPWTINQTWQNLLFMHWSLPPETIRPLVPPQLSLDCRDGKAWVSLLPMRLANLHLRGLPALPFASTFPEINLRTYVRFNGIAGVFFFSIDAPTRVGVWVSRILFHLPFMQSAMTYVERGDYAIESHRSATFAWPAADFAVRYQPVGDPIVPGPGSLEHFLSERHSFFAVGAFGIVYRGDINHEPWRLQRVKAQIEINTVARAARLELPPAPRLMYFSEGTEVLAWPVIPISL